MPVRVANKQGRAVLLVEGGTIDVDRASGGAFGPDPMSVLAHWDAFCDWAAGASQQATDPLDEADLGPCVPRPGSVFAVGLNYRAHAQEAGLEPPNRPMVFTKFPSCLAGPRSDIYLFSDRVDWEVELVVVIGRPAVRIAEDVALDYVAGYCVGQDISDRRLQFNDKPPQFSLGKSRETFGPIGPAIVSLDAFADPNDLSITCEVAGERMQDSRTADMIFPVPALVSYLSGICRLQPGDVIFSGTPSGVGAVREPRRYLQAGETIVSTIENVGSLTNRCVVPPY